MTPRGFTLLETIIYIGLFGILMSGVLVAVYQLIDGGVHNAHSVAIQEEGLFINRKMSWALSGASAVNAPDAKTLEITRPDLGAQSPIRISEDSGMMRLARGSAAPLPLTTSELVVSSTTITIIPSTGGIPASVRVSYQVEGVPFVFKSYLHF
jgi:type II secretory pathway pseudopilin PulG